MKTFLEILSILDTELSVSSGSFMALVMHLWKTIFLSFSSLFLSSHLLHLQTLMSSDEA